MRLLLIHRYFWPDGPPYAHMLREIARRFVKEGYEVTILSAEPSYHNRTRDDTPVRETVDGALVYRIRLLKETKSQFGRRVINTAIFLARVFAHVCRHRYDIVMFSTMPPIVLGLIVMLSLAVTRSRARPVYHMQDIYPEAALFAGLIRESVWYRVMRALDSMTCKLAAAVVVLSRDMRDTLVERGIDGGRIRVINNFSLVGYGAMSSRPSVGGFRKTGSECVVLFSGNIGRFQGLETVIDAAHALGNEETIQFWMMGDGIAKAALIERAGVLLGRTVHFGAYQPPEVAFEVMKLADLGIVCLKRGLWRVAYPSKTMTYLAAGCRLVVIAERESELASGVLANGLGAWCPPDDAVALARILWEEAGRRDKESLRRRAVTFATAHYSASVVLSRWLALVGELGASARTTSTEVRRTTCS